MESKINLLPEKDKLLKREAKVLKDVVEMSTPQDRIFKERVLRLSGVMEFFKTIFKRKPAALPKTKPAPVKVDASVQFPAPKPTIPAGPITRLMTMPERLAPPPPRPSAGKGFFSRIFRRIKKPRVPAATPAAKPFSFTSTTPSVPPARHASQGVAGGPPPPPPTRSPYVSPAPLPAAPLPPVRRPTWSPPVPGTHLPPPSQGSVPVPKPDQRPQPALTSHVLPPTGIPRPTGLSEVSPIMGVGLNVNLVPQEYQPEAPARDRFIALIAIGVAVFLVAAATAGLMLYQRTLDKKIAALDGKIDALKPQISAMESGPVQQANVLRQRTGDVQKLLNQHVYWDTFFTKFEAVTLPTVMYASMSADVSGSVTMSATATSFEEVGKQLLTYQNAKDFISQATILSATKVSGSAAEAPPGQTPAQPRELVSFSVSLRVLPQIFYHSN